MMRDLEKIKKLKVHEAVDEKSKKFKREIQRENYKVVAEDVGKW